MKKIIIIISVIIIAIISLYFGYFNNKGLINDYYNYINKKEIDNITLSDTEYTKSKFSEAQGRVNEDLLKIYDEVIKNDNNAKTLFDNFNNKEKRNEAGIKPLKKYINLINNSNNINELLKNMIDIDNELDLNVFMNFDVAKDLKDTSNYIVYFAPINFDYDAPCYMYNDQNNDYIKAYYKGASVKTLKLYGYDKKEARNISDNLDKMYTNICASSYKSDDLSDYEKIYNKINVKELKKIYSNLDIDYYLKVNGLDNEKEFIIEDINNYKNMNSYLTNDNLTLLKQHYILKILEKMANATSIDYLDIYVNLSNQLSGTSNNEDYIENYAYTIVANYFDSKISSIYLKEKFSNEDKIYIENMINEIILYYKEDINNITWLSDSTKIKALEKLDKMKINVGGPTNYSTYYKNYNLKSYNEGSNLVENAINMGKVINNYKLQKLKNKDLDDDFLVSITTVNAFYNVLDNSINFPASLTELYDKNDDYYTNLGKVGMIIAHEITHAFDNGGALFDSNGNMTNWWTKEDKETFEKLSKEVVNYYDKYEAINGIYVNGEKTLRENIADLSAVKAITNIAESKNAINDDYKNMYSSFAKMWVIKNNDYYEKLLLNSDTHSPNKVRVNATLSSTDKFYEIYNIKKCDKMYKKTKVGIW